MRPRSDDPQPMWLKTVPWIPGVLVSICLAAPLFAQSPEGGRVDLPSAVPTAPAAQPSDAGREPSVCLALPLSGPHATLGRRIGTALEGALPAAGVPHPIRRFDTAGQVGPAAAAVLRASEENCVVVIGPAGDRESLAVADAARTSGLPALVLGLAPDGREREGIAWVRTPRQEPISRLARFAAGALGARRVVVVRDESMHGRASAVAFAEAAKAAGCDVAGTLVLEPGRAAASALAERVVEILAAGRVGADCPRDAVFLAVDAGAARGFLPYLEFSGGTGRGTGAQARCEGATILGTARWNDPDRLSQSGVALEGAYFADVVVPPSVEGGRPRPLLEAEVEDAALLLAALLPAGGGDVRAGILASLSKGLAWKGATGDLSLSRGGVVGRRIGMYRITRGAAVEAVDVEGAGQTP